jgi:hypothetical protein
LRAVAADFFFNFWCLEILRITVFGTYKVLATIMRKALDWKRSRNFYVGSGSRTPELHFVNGDWFDYCFTYEKFVACGEFRLASE